MRGLSKSERGHDNVAGEGKGQGGTIGLDDKREFAFQVSESWPFFNFPSLISVTKVFLGLSGACETDEALENIEVLEKLLLADNRERIEQDLESKDLGVRAIYVFLERLPILSSEIVLIESLSSDIVSNVRLG